jgi:2-polyprenyl-3-methyl-5-hydroxy-6-metoxy-1,4-benzoquinol methylase
MATDTVKANDEGATQQRDALVERLFGATLGMMDILTVYIGDCLGLYRVLADAGPLPSAELARRAGVNERYAREWLEQQASAGILDVDGTQGETSERRYSLSPGHAEALLDRDSLGYITPLAWQMLGVVRPLPAILQAFRTGEGVPYREYGTDMRKGIALANRALFVNLMGTDWLPAIPDVHERLQADPPARAVDVGCGTGWSSISIARAYPKVLVDGLDLDVDSIAEAKANAAAEGLEDRVIFQVRNAADADLAGRYDLAIAIECIHDMSQPVEALRAMRGLIKEGGTVLVVDERVGESFSAPGSDTERLYYGFSVLHCLPVGMAEQPSAGTGTVMRPDTLRRYAREAGFRDLEVLPIENEMWRFYRLVE